MSGEGWNSAWLVPVVVVAAIISPFMYAWRAVKAMVARVRGTRSTS